MYQSFVGLEIHVQLLTQSKVFCGCRANFGDEPNTNICPVCAGYPGVLPALNAQAIEMAYAVARALNCHLSPECRFDRKNYFYPDLPKNYQISQFAQPLGTDGFIDLEFRKKKKRVRIHEIHLEEDAGKMIHAGDMSLLDFNRAGTPLLEIVTEPDLEIGEEAEVLLQELRRIVRYLGVCDGNMEEGSMRCDANVSVNERGKGLGRKVEVKNLNSSRFVRKAITFEIERQQEILERGGTVRQETRLWNENRDLTESMRSKESAHDYRYFPEPDLPRFAPDESFLARVEERLVELPALRRTRFETQYSLSPAQAEFLCDERATADYFEAAVAAGADAAQVAVWLAGDVRKLLNRHAVALEHSPLTPVRLATLLRLLDEGAIHGKIAKQVLDRVFSDDEDPEAIIAAEGWQQLTDRAQLGTIVDAVLAEHPAAIDQIRAGDTRPMGFLVGKIMKATDGRAEPRAVQQLLRERLDFRLIHVLSFGGAISGTRQSDGLVEGGELVDVRAQFAGDAALPGNVRFDEVQLGRFLSEEITPSDWAALIETVQRKLEEGNTSGIVIGHGTDTLAYTAGLLYWFFADARVPIVLTAAASPTEAPENLKAAILTAAGDEPGVHVVYGGADFYALNLKFERVGAPSADARSVEDAATVPDAPRGTGVPTASGAPSLLFRNWNAEGLQRGGRALAAAVRSLDREKLTRALERALNATFVVKVYPGMRGDALIPLMDAGVRYFVLEIYDTGTANLRETPFSLKKAFAYGNERGVRFFCTSQQEGVVDFSEYVTAHQLWREGAVPMGRLTTESVLTRLVAAQLVAEDDAELLELMEDEV